MPGWGFFFQGDSGGPAVHKADGKWTVHGITSTGPTPCQSSSAPQGFVKVSAYIKDFIEPYMEPSNGPEERGKLCQYFSWRPFFLVLDDFSLVRQASPLKSFQYNWDLRRNRREKIKEACFFSPYKCILSAPTKFSLVEVTWWLGAREMISESERWCPITRRWQKLSFVACNNIENTLAD